MGRFRELDGLRGIAAFGVVLSHFILAYDERYVDDPRAFGGASVGEVISEIGAYGVNLFFLISGFVVLVSARRAKRPSDFVISRFSRLYPPYWVALVLAVVLAWVASIPHVPLDWKTIVANLSMVQRWFLQSNVDGVYWTLAVEMQFYVLLLILLLITKCRIGDRLICGVSALWLSVSVIAAAVAFPHAHGLDPQHVATPYKILVSVTLAEYGPLFCAGMLLFISRERGRIVPLAYVAGAAAVLNTGLIASWPKAAWIAGIVLCFFVVALRRQTRTLLLPPLQWLGKVSYSLYLTHTFVGFIVIHLTWPFIGRDTAILAAILVSFAVAWAVYEVAEKRLSPMVAGWLKGWRDKRGPTGSISTESKAVRADEEPA